MSIRGDTSRKKILEASRKLFAAKGFSAVSMQDICNASGLSRGGLYRHYTSTEDVFSAIIAEEQATALASLEKAKAMNVPPDKILINFLRSRTSQLLDPELSIDNATAEFAVGSAHGREILQKRALACAEIVEQILTLGSAQGVFKCRQCRETALLIIWSLEGMGKHNVLLPLSPEETEAQLKLILNFLY